MKESFLLELFQATRAYFIVAYHLINFIRHVRPENLFSLCVVHAPFTGVHSNWRIVRCVENELSEKYHHHFLLVAVDRRCSD